MSENIVTSFYKFSPWYNYSDHKDSLLAICEQGNILGTILIAKEGINGTVSGEEKSLSILIDYITALKEFKDLKPKFSLAYGRTFTKMRVRIKKEIVSMGQPEVNPHHKTGEMLNSLEWDKLLDEEDVIIVDARNKFEQSIGFFEGATFSNMISFREFPKWADSHLEDSKDKKIAMYCTGGIRCEKASSYLINKGFKNVYQLDGGILKYLEDKERSESKWKGECFVFDYRVSLEHKLEKGSYDMCHGCRMPITDMDKLDKHYVKGVSCPKCFAKKSPNQKKRYAERQKQIDLAKLRNQKHIGAVSQTRKK